MSKIPCEVIRDLFPSYIDGLTSDITNREIDAHIADCSDCRDILESMKGPEQEEHIMSENEKKEIDFLKKNRKRNKRVLIVSIAAALVLAVVVAGLRFFAADSKLASSSIVAKVKVDGNHLVIDGDVVDSIHVINSVKFAEEEGVVTVDARAGLSGGGSGRFHNEYDAAEPIKQVWLNGRVLWDDGEDISSYVSSVYATRHDYMGDMSANNRTAAALHMNEYLGEWTNELESSQQPYRWRIILSEPVEKEKQVFTERYMDAYAYILLGVIGNLDEVEYVYTVSGEQLERTVTVSDADEFFHSKVKLCGSAPKELARLIDATGINRVFPAELDADGMLTVISGDHEYIIKAVNDTGEDIDAVGISVYLDGELYSSQTGQNADNSPIEPGESIFLDIRPEDIGDSAENQQVSVYLDVYPSSDETGEAQPIDVQIELNTTPDETYVVYITGDKVSGYELEVIGDEPTD